MRFFVDVILLAQNALMLVGATVADIRGFEELVTELLFVIFAQFIAHITGGTTFNAVWPVLTKVSCLTFGTFHASVVDTVWSILVTGRRTGTNFP
jgi:hypothetical protein